MIYLKNTSFIDFDNLTIKRDVNIKVFEGRDGGIEFIDDDEVNQISDGKIIDCDGKLVSESFVNGHHHIYSTLARGMPSPRKTPKNFYEILKYIWWNIDKKLNNEMIESSALFSAVESLKNGVTFVIDHHSSPFAVDGSLEIIAEAFERVGVSHLLCYEISDRDGEDIAQKGIDETERYLKNHKGLVGLHASFTVGDETLKKAVRLSEKYNSGIHIHTAEDEYDQNYCKENYNMRVVERLEKFGVLNFEKTILAHCIHIDEKEREILRKNKTFIVQNPESNLNNAVGVFASKDLDYGRIMIGTDGMHGDILRSLKSSYLLSQNFDDISPEKIIARLTNNKKYLSINEFSGNGRNNLIIYDYNSPTEINAENIIGHLLYGINSNHIESVITDGELVLENGKATRVNEEEILKYSMARGKELWKVIN